MMEDDDERRLMMEDKLWWMMIMNEGQTAPHLVLPTKNLSKVKWKREGIVFFCSFCFSLSQDFSFELTMKAVFSMHFSELGCFDEG